MKIFMWNEKLASGIELLDSQHREIIEHANAFFIAYKCGNSDKKARECLNFLSQYILYHFQAEEAFFVDCGYPKYREHQASHGYLATQVKFHSVTIEESGFSPDSITAFYDFLSNWIVNHILTDDMEFAMYYREMK